MKTFGIPISKHPNNFYNLTLKERDRVILLWANGSGKSTYSHHLCRNYKSKNVILLTGHREVMASDDKIDNLPKQIGNFFS